MMWKKGLAILFLVSIVMSASALEVTQIHEVDGIPFLRPFSIFLEKSVYVQGELARATEFQNINENCDNLSASFFFKDSSQCYVLDAENILQASQQQNLRPSQVIPIAINSLCNTQSLVSFYTPILDSSIQKPTQGSRVLF